MSAKRGAPKPPKATLYDANMVGPEALEVGRYPTDAQLRQWWDRAKVYTDAMRGLDRVTMLCFDHDTNNYYLASIEGDA